ncbi:ERF family protein [Synechococcus lacustris Tous-12m]
MKDLAAALCQFQASNTFAPTDSKGNYGAYTSLASVLSICSKASEFGLCHIQTIKPIGMAENSQHVLTTILLHSSGDRIESEMMLPSKAENQRNPMQALGSALTYARRYALLAIYGLASDDDDGQNSAPALATAQRPRPLPASMAVTAEQPTEFLHPQRKASIVERLKASASKVQILKDFKSEFNISSESVAPGHILLPAHADFIESCLAN